jgi:hypothetical protein
MKTKLREIVAGLAVAGLLAAAPVAFAQQAAAPEAAAKSGVRTYTGGRHHEDTTVTTVAPTTDKSISEKGVKKTEAPPVEAAIAPPADAGKGHSEKGIK